MSWFLSHITTHLLVVNSRIFQKLVLSSFHVLSGGFIHDTCVALMAILSSSTGRIHCGTLANCTGLLSYLIELLLTDVVNSANISTCLSTSTFACHIHRIYEVGGNVLTVKRFSQQIHFARIHENL